MPPPLSPTAEPRADPGALRARVVARRYHPHTPGLVYAAITVLLVVGAVQGQNNLLMWVFSLAVAGLVLSGVLSGSILMRLDIERRVIPPAHAGGRITIEYVVRNRSWVPALALVIEELPAWKRGRHRATWPGFMPAPGVSLACVPARGTASASVVLHPWCRGVATFDALRVLTTFPFGLTLKSVVYSQPSHARIRPWLPALPRGVFATLLAPSEQVERSHARRGSGHDFFSLRDYASGDSTRAIAWRATAKRGDIVVRETAERRGTPLTLLIDPAGTPDALERVVSLAGALARDASTLGMPLAIRSSGAFLRSAAGARHIERVLDLLVDLAPGATPAIAPRGQRVVVVTANPGRWDGAAVASIDDPRLVPADVWNSAPRAPASPRRRGGFLRRFFARRGRA